MFKLKGLRFGGVGLALQIIGVLSFALTVQADRLTQEVFALKDESVTFRADVDEGVSWLAAVRSIQTITRDFALTKTARTLLQKYM